MHYTTSPLWINEIPKYPMLSVLSVGFSIFTVCQNIRRRFGFSVQRPMTSGHSSERPSEDGRAKTFSLYLIADEDLNFSWFLLVIPIKITAQSFSTVANVVTSNWERCSGEVPGVWCDVVFRRITTVWGRLRLFRLISKMATAVSVGLGFWSLLMFLLYPKLQQTRIGNQLRWFTSVNVRQQSNVVEATD